MKSLTFKKGFTLIELLVVISIIGLLASVVLSNINVARQKASDTQVLQTLFQIKNGIEQYYSDNKNFITSTVSVDLTANGNTTNPPFVPNYVAIPNTNPHYYIMLPGNSTYAASKYNCGSLLGTQNFQSYIIFAFSYAPTTNTPAQALYNSGGPLANYYCLPGPI